MMQRNDDESPQPGWFVGGYMDDTISDAGVDRIKDALTSMGGNIDAEQFIPWMRRELASYRNLKDISDSQPVIRQDREATRLLEAKVADLLNCLSEMSPNVASRLHAQLDDQLKSHGNPSAQGPALIGAVESGLTELRFSLIQVQYELGDVPTPGKGRKRNTLRDDLMNKVANWLVSVGAPKVNVPDTAAQILIACGILAPQDGRSRPDKRVGKK